ncbi:MAG: hypothetical protein Q7J45_01335 [bacterium]|nr:hypothetical protein [bacterium]
MRGAQIRKLAKPKIKKVGISFSGITLPIQMIVSADIAHDSIIAQNNLNVMYSVIT